MTRIVIAVIFIAIVSASAYAEDRKAHSIRLKSSGGHLWFEVPESWGRKPEVEQGENATLIHFTPFGTPREPIFSVRIVAAVAEEPISAEHVRQAAEAIRDEFRETALEENVVITDIAGGDNMISYFTLTDKEIKPREFQYLTAAVVSDGTVVCSFWFFSNDGAPDYAADALHLMETVRYVPKAEKK